MSVDFKTVDEFLEHHGTKGMRWGVRKERSISDAGRTGRTKAGKKLTRQQRKLVNRRHGLSTGQKVAIGVGVAGAVGAAFVAAKLLQNRRATLREVKATTDFAKGTGKAHELLKSVGSRPMVSGRNPFKAPQGLVGAGTSAGLFGR